MIGHRLGARMSGERGFTLIELLVVMILIGILAAIALAVFLRQQDKAKDADAKSAVTNIAREMQACFAGNDPGEDYRVCDSADKLPEQNFKIDPTVSENDPCTLTTPAQVLASPPASGFDLKIVEAGKNCFSLIGVSGSGNKFVYIKHEDGSVERGCETEGVNGCPAGGQWAG